MRLLAKTALLMLESEPLQLRLLLLRLEFEGELDGEEYPDEGDDEDADVEALVQWGEYPMSGIP